MKNTSSEIKELTANENVSGFVSDLSDFNSIKKMINDVSNEFSSIDILINNAGVLKSPIQNNQDDLDMRFAVNYFAPYLLTNGLLPILKNSISPRIINLSSAAQSTVSMDALKGKLQISSNEAYAQSKLALTMWSFDFARENQNIITIAVNPGSLLNTRMANEAYGQHWSPAEKGVDILYDLALSTNHNNNSGKYFDNDKGVFSEAHNDAYNQKIINELLTETIQILKK